jgi:prevent-host-death family protein
LYYYGGLDVMPITASKARKEFFRLIKKVNEDHDAIEIVSKHGNAVLVSAEDYVALREPTCCGHQPMPVGCSAPTRMP